MTISWEKHKKNSKPENVNRSIGVKKSKQSGCLLELTELLI